MTKEDDGNPFEKSVKSDEKFGMSAHNYNILYDYVQYFRKRRLPQVLNCPTVNASLK